MRDYADKVMLPIVIGLAIALCLLLDRLMHRHAFDKTR
jgi:hypothetical protein